MCAFKTPSVSLFRTSQCMPATRAHVFQHVRVLAGIHGDVLNVHTGAC